MKNVLKWMILLGLLAVLACGGDDGGPVNGGQKEKICDDGVDNDNDGYKDCDDNDCECNSIACMDGVDNDEDGDIDCFDSGCPPCEICNDSVDNDQDGLIDCDDPDCLGSGFCP